MKITNLTAQSIFNGFKVAIFQTSKIIIFILILNLVACGGSSSTGSSSTDDTAETASEETPSNSDNQNQDPEDSNTDSTDDTSDADETSEIIDADDDGFASDLDCNDNNASLTVITTYYRDADEDGYGDILQSIDSCGQPAGYVTNSTDCDDENSDAHTLTAFYQDSDSDTLGTASVSVDSCGQPDGYVADASDCDDTNDTITTYTFCIDNDSDSYGSESDCVQACSAPTGYLADATDCDDSNANINPSELETLNSTDDDCNDKIDDINISSSDVYNQLFVGEAKSTYTYQGDQYQFLASGDFDGDSKTDIVFSAKGYNSKTGFVCLRYGPVNFDSGTPQGIYSDADFCWDGENTGDEAGSYIANAGDVNGDSCDDLLIAAQSNNDSASLAGKVYLIFGRGTACASSSAFPSLASADVIFTGDAANVASKGISLSTAGDVDNDSYDDFLMGFPNGGSVLNQGETYLVYGSSSLSGSYSISDIGNTSSGATISGASFLGEATSDLAGYSVSSAGDFDNNGYDDFIIGAYGYDDSNGNVGRSYLIYGKSRSAATTKLLGSVSLSAVQGTSFLNSYGMLITGVTDGESIGRSVSSAKDVNGDGFSDILIASPNDLSLAGITHIIYGCNLASCPSTKGKSKDLSTSDTDAQFIGENVSDRSGSHVVSAGDVNNDGYDDFLIAATYYDLNASYEDSGIVYLILGSETDLSGNISLSNADASFYTDHAAYEHLGNSVAVADNTSGDTDGIKELFVLSPAYINGSYTGAGAIYALELNY